MRKIISQFLVLFVLLASCHTLFAAPNPPVLTLSSNELHVDLSWTNVTGATGYTLLYAPYPYQGEHTIESLDMATATSLSVDLPNGAAYYVAIQAYDAQGSSDYSNVDYFILSSAGGDTGNSSFFPLAARSSSGSSSDAYWLYRVNNGQPLQISVDGYTLGLQVQDLRLDVNSQAMTRTANFSAQISGVASGNITTAVTEQLSSLQNATLVQSQSLSLNTTLSAQGQSVQVGINANVAYQPSAEWFLDRDDLDQLNIGYVYSEQGNVSASVSGSLAITSSIGNINKPIPQTTVTSPERWEITGHQNNITVQGKTYQNIVVVKRTTAVPQADTSGNLSTVSIDITYWVAKGIGMVKGEGQYNILGQPLTIELVETNLTN